MTKRRLVSLGIAALICALLGAGYAVVLRNTTGADAAQETPTGFIH
jgi:hypothetical protein